MRQLRCRGFQISGWIYCPYTRMSVLTTVPEHGIILLCPVHIGEPRNDKTRTYCTCTGPYTTRALESFRCDSHECAVSTSGTCTIHSNQRSFGCKEKRHVSSEFHRLVNFIEALIVSSCHTKCSMWVSSPCSQVELRCTVSTNMSSCNHPSTL